MDKKYKNKFAKNYQNLIFCWIFSLKTYNLALLTYNIYEV